MATYSTKSPWKLTTTRRWSPSQPSNNEQSFFIRDQRYKSCIRWEHKLVNCSTIQQIKVEKSDKLSLKTSDSFTVVLKIQGIAEKNMGTIDVTSPIITYNTKQWLSNITRSSVYVRVYVYQRASGLSSTTAYQAAGDNYNIFMSELREIWRKQLIDILIKDKILKENKINQYENLTMPQFYDLCKKLHKKCKNHNTWNDFQQAFETSFGAINDNQNKNNTNNNNYSFGSKSQFASSGVNTVYNLRSNLRSKPFK